MIEVIFQQFASVINFVLITLFLAVVIGAGIEAGRYLVHRLTK